MPRTCTICTHPDHEAINKALVEGAAVSVILSRYFTIEGKTLGRMAVQRHKDNHLPESLSKAKDAAEVAHGDSLLDELKTLQKITQNILAKAYRSEDLPTALKAIGEARKNVELLAKLMGELDERPVVNLTLSGEWLQVRAVIVNALSDYPEAKQRVARALTELEQ